jgi:hypothetical protein
MGNLDEGGKEEQKIHKTDRARFKHREERSKYVNFTRVLCNSYVLHSGERNQNLCDYYAIDSMQFSLFFYHSFSEELEIICYALLCV